MHIEFLNKLLRPTTFVNSPDQPFPFHPKKIIELCDAVEQILSLQPTMVEMKSAVKIFGDIHGQYSDLMRFFDLFGSPYDTYSGQDADITKNSFLFLGDYVDRGSHSLETVCMLFALKIKYPKRVYLLRGNHEEIRINTVYGFSQECRERLQENPMDLKSVYRRINRVFEFLPLAALIDKKVLCLHGGIGAHLKTLD